MHRASMTARKAPAHTVSALPVLRSSRSRGRMTVRRFERRNILCVSEQSSVNYRISDSCGQRTNQFADGDPQRCWFTWLHNPSGAMRTRDVAMCVCLSACVYKMERHRLFNWPVVRLVLLLLLLWPGNVTLLAAK